MNLMQKFQLVYWGTMVATGIVACVTMIKKFW